MGSAPSVGPVVEKVTRTRTIPANEAAKDGKVPDFWDYIEQLTPEQWTEHTVYIYREEPKVSNYGAAAYVDKCSGYIEIRPGVQVPMDERGMIEAAIKEKFGGKAFRLICKKGRERITEGKCVNEAPPKYPDTQTQHFAGPLPNAPTDASVASKAIDAMAAQQPDAVRLAMEVLRAASDIVMKSAHPAPPVTPPSSVDEELKRILLQRALNPPDPLETFVKLKDILSPPAKSGVTETLELIGALRNSGLFPAGGGKTSLIDLGREAIPALAQTVDRAMTNWRMGVEAQRDAIAMQRGMNPGPAVSAAPAAAIPAQPLPPAASAEAAPTPERGADSATPGAPVSNNPPFEWLEMKIVEIFKDQEYTVDQAVDETLAFLYRAHPAVVQLLLDPPKLDQRLSPGEQGLLQLFQNRPILQQIQVGPRLTEFIKKFIAAAKETEAGRVGAPTAAPPANAPSA